jgi:predicted dehydrogenase
MEGVDALLALARERRRVLQVGYVLRGHPCLRLIREWLREGAIGDVLTARVIIGYHVPTYRPDYRDTYWARTETGGGVLFDASHQLDYLLWLLGPARQVSALTARLGDWDVAAGVEDAAVLLVRFASGAIADLQMNHIQRNYTHELVLAGRTGTITWSYTESEAALFRAADDRWERRRFPLERDDLFRAQAAGFAAAARGQEAPGVTGEDGARALALALAAGESARTGRVIELEGSRR